MRVIMTFNLPKDDYEYKLANNAVDMFHILLQVKEAIRSRLKYGEPSEAEAETLEELRRMIFDGLPALSKGDFL